MGATPDQLKHDIEQTRGELTSDVDALADRVSPTAMAHRTTERVRSRFGSARDRVMGSAHDATGATQDKAGDVADATRGMVQQAPQQVKAQTQGSPLAAGLIAFGAGVLAAALLPATETEQRVGGQLRDNAGELAQPVKQAAAEAGQHLRETVGSTAQDAVAQVKETAADAAQTTAGHAQEAGEQVRTEAAQSAAQVRDDARDGAAAVRERASSAAE